MHNIELSPAANSILEDYAIRCLTDNGEECALLFLDAFDDKVSYLENSPPIGCPRLKRVPLKYRF